jgi:hypothetical protein
LRLGEVLGRSGNELRLAPGRKPMIGIDAEHIAFAGGPEGGSAYQGLSKCGVCFQDFSAASPRG